LIPKQTKEVEEKSKLGGIWFGLFVMGKRKRERVKKLMEADFLPVCYGPKLKQIKLIILYMQGYHLSLEDVGCFVHMCFLLHNQGLHNGYFKYLP
jgi:hypothetical protein